MSDGSNNSLKDVEIDVNFGDEGGETQQDEQPTQRQRQAPPEDDSLDTTTTSLENVDIDVDESQFETDRIEPLLTDIRSAGASKRTGIDTGKLAEQTDREDFRLEDLNDLQKMRAEAQGPLAEGANALRFIPKIPLGIAEQAGYLLDFTRYDDILQAGVNKISGQEGEGEADVTNPFSEAMRDASKALDRTFPIYRDNPNAVWDVWDTAWWAQNGSMLAETMGEFAATGYGISKGIGLLAKGVKSGVAAGAGVNTVRGGAKVARGIDRVSDLASASLLGHAEGSMVGMQMYDQTYKQVKEKLQNSDKDLTQEQIEKRATTAASQGAATATAVNSVVFPFLNYTSAKLLSGATASTTGRVSKQLKSKLNKLDEPTMANLKSIKSKLDDFEPTTQAGSLTGELKRTGAEAFQESVEELGAVVAEEEGRETALSKEGMGTDRSVGERLTDALFTPQAALEATLGAIGGAGQYGIMSNIPSVEAGDDFEREDGAMKQIFGDKITRRQYRRKAEQQQINKEKEIISSRIDDLVEAKGLLEEANNEEDKEKAERKRNRGMRKLKVANSSSSVARGVSQQVKRFYEGILNMDENQAESEGLDVDKDSDTYYKNLAREQIEDIERYEDLYDNLVDQYNFGAKEEFAGVPELLLQLQIQEDQAKKNINRLKKEKEETIENIQENYSNLAEGIVENESLRAEEEAVAQRNKLLFNLIDQLNNVDSQRAEEMSLEELVSLEPTRASEEVSKTLSELSKTELNEIFDNTRDLNVNQAIELFSSLASQRESRLVEIKEERLDNPYQEYLDQNNLEDSETNRKAFEELVARAENKVRNEELTEINSDIESERESLEGARKRFDEISTADGRQQMVDRAEKAYTANRERVFNQFVRTINQVQTEEELDRVKREASDLDIDGIEEEIERRREELRTERRREQDDKQRVDIEDIREKYTKEDAKEKIKEDVDKSKEEFVESVELSEEETTTEESQEEQQQKEEVEEESGSFSTMVNRMFSESEEEQEGEDATTQEEGVYQNAKDSIEEFIGLNHKKISESVDNPQEYIEDAVEDIAGNLDTDIDVESLKTHAVNEYERRRKIANEDESEAQKQEGEQDENIDSPLDNPSTEPGETTDDVEAESSVKNPEIGHTVTYISQESVEIDGTLYERTTERSDKLEYDPIEHWDVVSREENIELAVMNESLDDGRLHTTASDLDGVDNIGEEQVDTANIGIFYTEGDRDQFIGYLTRPDRITDKTTPEEDVENQKNRNRTIRRKVLENHISGKDRTRGTVTSKTAGQLTRNYETNEDGDIIYDNNGNPTKEPQTVSEGFPDQQVEYYIIRGGNIDNGETTDDVSISQLHNNREFFQGNEGSAGLLVRMGNGKKMAVPVWLPKINEIDEPIVDTIFEMARRMEEDNPVVETDLGPNISLTEQIEERVSDYVYVSSDSGIFEISNDESKTRPHIVIGNESKNVHVIYGEDVYSTDRQLANENDDVQLLSENEDVVKEAIGEMRFNVESDKINQYENDRDNFRISMNDEGNLEVIDYNTYNEFISDYILTDLDASYSVTNPNTGETNHLVYQHPTPRFKLDDQGGSSKSTTSPNISPNHSGEQAGQQQEDTMDEDDIRKMFAESEEDTESDSESKVQGDSEDVETPAGDAQTTSTSQENQQQEEDIIIDDETIVDRLEDNVNQRAVDNLMDFFDSPQDILDTTRAELEDNVDQVGQARSNMIMDVVEDLQDEIEQREQQMEMKNIDIIRSMMPTLLDEQYLLPSDIADRFDAIDIDRAQEVINDLDNAGVVNPSSGNIKISDQEQIEKALSDEFEDVEVPDAFKTTVRDQYDDLNTRKDQQTEVLQRVVNELKNLRNQLDRTENEELYNEIEEDINKLGVELTSRDGVNEQNNQTDPDTNIPDDVADEMTDELFDDFSQRTPSRDKNISETTDSEETVRDVAEENQDYNCKT